MSQSNLKKTANLNALSKADQETLSKIESVAGQIRFLHARKMSTGDISRYLTAIHPDKPVRYQWVRNVLLQPLKKQA